MLGGQESLDANMHLQRPSFEKDRCNGTTWKINSHAAIQLAPGHPKDPTFADMELPAFAILDEDQANDSGGAKR